MPQTTEIMEMHPAAWLTDLDEDVPLACMLAPEEPPDALGQDPALVVEGVLRKILRGEALRFAATEEEAACGPKGAFRESSRQGSR